MTSAEPLSDGVLFLHFAAGMLIILALMGAFAFALRYALMKGWLPGGLKPRTTEHLQICETLALDARRRLVLVRCDETAYLLLLAPDHSLVVSSTSLAMSAPRSPASAASVPVAPLSAPNA